MIGECETLAHARLGCAMGIEITRTGGNRSCRGSGRHSCLPCLSTSAAADITVCPTASKHSVPRIRQHHGFDPQDRCSWLPAVEVRASGSSSHCLLGLFDRIADALERFGQIERLGQIRQPFGDEPTVFVGSLGQGQTISAKLESHKPRAAVGGVDAKETSRFVGWRLIRGSPAAAPAPGASTRVPGPPKRALDPCRPPAGSRCPG